MTIKDLEVLYDYGYWANGKLFEVIAQLTPEQFTRPVAGSYGSIRNTMVHVLSAEAGWLDRCGGRSGAASQSCRFPNGGICHTGLEQSRSARARVPGQVERRRSGSQG